ncbi:MAG: thioester reductase domain-containing protein [Opitutaceae bacterium]
MTFKNSPEPIAIVGMGLKFPGNANDVSSFWQLMMDGVDAIQEIPEDRWSTSKYYHSKTNTPGKTYAKWGGFVDDFDRFDAKLFDLSVAEAEAMDPQQRFLLEATWHAIEDSGTLIDKSRGDNIGVFIGSSTRDYELLSMCSTDFEAPSAYSATGSANSITANRISHAFNLKGPSVAFDTACSSSLVALHYACQSLRNEECNSAFVGGVNFIMNPTTWIAFCGMSALSKDGRCKAFDATADGFVRSEGAGVVLIKPLSKAIEDKDRIYACIRETGCNQDGRTSAISLPDQNAQEALIKQTLKKANLKPQDICYVEAHGTGTSVGDPIEATAIGNALGIERPTDSPLILGSVKSNIGHMEAGAGIAGLIKSALVLWKKEVPPNIHFSNGNPNIPFDALNLKVPVEKQSLSQNAQGEPLYSCVNSFGFGGTNAHAILQSQENSVDTDGLSQTESNPILALSAQSEGALASLADAYSIELRRQPLQWGALCDQSITHRNRLKHRLLVTGDSADAIASTLDTWSKGEPTSLAISGSASHRAKKGVVFVFSGQGSQWHAMGRDLYRSNSVFKEKIDVISKLILELDGFDLVAELSRSAEESKIQKTEIAQPAIFAVQVALADYWQASGIEPAAVVGHSVGEVAAAHVAGVLSLEDAVRVIFYRGDTMKHAEGGKMIAVGITQEAAITAIQSYGERLSLAAVNSPTSVSISGDPDALEEIFPLFEAKGVFCRHVPVDYAFHSAQMNPVESELLPLLRSIRPQAPRIPIYSTVTGARVTETSFDADYWWQNVRKTVRFADAVSALIKEGYTAFLELSSHPVLRPSLQQCCEAEELSDPSVTYSLHKTQEAQSTLFQSLASLYNAGYAVNLAVASSRDSGSAQLPLYPFEREKFWRESPQWKTARLEKVTHPFLFFRTRDVQPAWHFWANTKLFAYLNDHLVDSRIIVPAAGFMEMGIAVAHQLLDSKRFVFEEIEFKQALFIADNQSAPAIRTAYDSATASFQIHSCADAEFKNWKLHAEGSLRATQKAFKFSLEHFRQAQSRCHHEWKPEDFYQLFKQVDLQYGPHFQGVKKLSSGEGEAFAEIEIALDDDPSFEQYFLHPALLDSALQTILATVPIDAQGSMEGPYLPVWVNRLRFEKKAGKAVHVHTQLTSFNENELVAELTITDPSGELVAQLEGFRCQRVATQRTQKDYGSKAKFLEARWERSPLSRQTDASLPSVFFPPFESLNQNVLERMASFESQLETNSHGSRYEHLDNLCLAYCQHGFEALGAEIQVGTEFTWEGFIQTTGILPAYHLLIRRLFQHLEQSKKLISVAENRWRWREVFTIEDTSKSTKSWIQEHPSGVGDVGLSIQVGLHFAEAITGKIDILAILFGAKNAHLLESSYRSSLSSRATNHTIKVAVEGLVKDVPVGRRLRILEIGAGTGATAQEYLSFLTPGSYEFTFTDISEAFFLSAEKKLDQYPNIVYKKLDVTRAPTEQGLAADYDIIIAVNVLHATPSLRASLENARKLLRPNGYFLLVDLNENVPASLDFGFGLTPGWWSFEDYDIRPSHCCIGAEQWTSLIKDSGFQKVSHVPDSSLPSSSNANTFLAQADEVEYPVSLPAETQSINTWLILADSRGIGKQLQKTLQARGQVSDILDFRDWDQRTESILERANRLENLGGIIYLWSLDAPLADIDELDTKALEATQELTVHIPSAILREFAQAEMTAKTYGLWLVTRNALHVLPSDVPDVVQSALQGMGRVAFNELRELPLRLIDLSASSSVHEMELFVDELLAYPEGPPRDEDLVAFRGEGRYLVRIHSAAPIAHEPHEPVSVHELPCRVTSNRFGMLDALCLEQIERQVPSEDEVEVKIFSVGMNFRDVMKALRIYPTTIGDAKMLGDEFAGEVVSVGSKVTRFAVGDRITGISMGTFRSFWTGSANSLCHLPDKFSYDEGATLLTAYITGYHALHEIGRLKTGERVLIHSAAGGVGLAAVRLAQAAGAEVFATAGADNKRDLLRLLGVKHLFNSRTLEFADEIMEVTQGEGVDIVLNALAGEAIPKSLKCLRQGGRFLEIGKRDIYENTRLGLRPFMNGLSFSSIDLAASLQSSSSVERIENIERLLAEDALAPLPYNSLPFSQPARIFRQMSLGQHVGKLVMSLYENKARPAAIFNPNPLVFERETSALITGGTRGLGLSFARYFIERGCKNLILVSRSGLSAENSELIEFLEMARSKDVNVVVKALDIAIEADVKAMLGEIRSELPPLTTVVHSAFLLADELFLRMTREHYITALRAKVSGAWNLHRWTQEDPIEQFVMLSSLASVIGSAAQANYVAANVFLEQLAEVRRSQNKAGLTINLDMINDTGFVARNEEISEYLNRAGWTGMSANDTIDCIEKLMVNGSANKSIYSTSIAATAKAYPFIRQLGRFKIVLEESIGDDSEERSQRIRQEILNAADEDRQEIVETYLCEQIGKILRAPAKSITRDGPLNQQGVDSLMAVELISLLEGDLGIAIPTSNMMNAPSVVSLSTLMIQLLTGESTPLPQALLIDAQEDSIYPLLSESQTAEEDLEQLLQWLADEPLQFSTPNQTNRLLLTGANGFLGIYTLHDLLTRTDEQIICMVRGKDGIEARKKLIDSWKHYRLDTALLEEHSNRWSILCADLSKPNLGLDSSAYDSLSHNIDSILHCGAAVSHVSSYPLLRQVNVLGTLELIKLAGRGAAKSLHFTSSVAIYDTITSFKSELNPPDALENMLEGYGQSKAICEHLLNAAKLRGLIGHTYRIGPVVGDGVSGISASHDFVWIILKACLYVGASPVNDWNLYLTPVDYACRVIVESLKSDDSNLTLHVVNQDTVSFNDLSESIRRNGYTLDAISMQDWLSRATESKSQLDISTYFVFREEAVANITETLHFPELGHEVLDTVLDKYGISSVRMDEKRLDFYIDFFIQSGFFPEPSKMI